MPTTIAHPLKRAFLAAFAECGNVRRSAELAGISRESHYDWKAGDPEYAAAFLAAQEQAADALEDIARDRATADLLPSDRLLIFLLQGAKPEKYKQRVASEVSGAIAHQHALRVDLSLVPDDELELLERIAQKVIGPASDPGREGTPPQE